MFNAPFQNSMYWFEGVVEDRQDPIKLGRVRVRVIGIHTENLANIPTSELFWMQVMLPTTSASISGVGESAGMVEGSHVIGFFRDGSSCQDGVVIGTVGGIPQTPSNTSKGFNDTRKSLSQTPGTLSEINFNGSGAVLIESPRVNYPRTINESDTSRLTRNLGAETGTVLKHKIASRATQVDIGSAGDSTFSEPNPPYAAVYPYNKVRETESGHVLEMDDTPGAERVHLAHRTGSFTEFHPDGTVVNKAVKDSYNITHGSAYEHIVGQKTVTIDKGSKLLVAAKSGHFEIEVGSGGSLMIKVAGDVELEVAGDMTTTCGGTYTVNAEQINLN